MEKIINCYKSNDIIFHDDIKSGILGFVIGDCLGLPVEFKTREGLKQNQVKEMLEKGSHFQPKGTWSDDTSMVLATMASLIELKGYNSKSFYNIADKFVDWYKKGYYSPNGEVFDIGNTTKLALDNYVINRNKECGLNSLYDNGNGSLMRIIPLAYYFRKANLNIDQIKNIVFEVSSITHSHIISKYACLMYIMFLLNIFDDYDKEEAYDSMLETINEFLENEEKQNKKIIKETYKRILKGNLDTLKEKDIKSTGYVVDTLEAVLWIVLNSKDYKESVLKAVNLGDDTDTIGALAGGLLGAIYGYCSIPTEWLESVRKKEEILKLCEAMEKTKFVKEYITIAREKLDEDEFLTKYDLLYKTLAEYRDYNKELNLNKSKDVEEFAWNIMKKLMEIKILCSNYSEMTEININYLGISNNKKEIINKLDICESLALLTMIQRQSYFDGGYTQIFYEYTKNEIMPLLINRVLDIIENVLKIK